MLRTVAIFTIFVWVAGLFLAAHGVVSSYNAMQVVYGDSPRYSHPYMSQLPAALVVLATGLVIIFVAAKGLDALYAVKMRKKALAREKRKREQNLVAFMERDDH